MYFNFMCIYILFLSFISIPFRPATNESNLQFQLLPIIHVFTPWKWPLVLIFGITWAPFLIWNFVELEYSIGREYAVILNSLKGWDPSVISCHTHRTRWCITQNRYYFDIDEMKLVHGTWVHVLLWFQIEIM